MQFARRYFISMGTRLSFFSCCPLTARRIINLTPPMTAPLAPMSACLLDILPRLLDNFAQRGLRTITLNSAIP